MEGERHRQPGMDPDTEQRGVIPKRGLPTGLHSPSHRLPLRREATRLITWATSTTVAFLPSIRLGVLAARLRPRGPPNKNPIAVGSLTGVAEKSNSRFFTDCYHRAAALRPFGRREAYGVRRWRERFGGL